MNLYLAELFSSKRTRQIQTTLLALASLTILLWAVITDLKNRCYADQFDQTAACQTTIEFAVPFFVALGFWTIGLLLWLVSQHALVLGFFVLIADILAVGMLSGTGAATDDASRVFQILLAWATPLTFHFFYSLLDRRPGRTGSIILCGLYGLAVALSLPFFLWTVSELDDAGWFIILRTSVRLALAMAWMLGWLLLFREYQRHPSARVRQRIRLITFGTLFGFAPLVFLSLLPGTLGQFHLPYELTFPWLLLSPLAYLYSLLRHRLVSAELALNRAGVYYLFTLSLLSVFLLTTSVLGRFAVNSAGQWPWVNVFLSVVLLLLFAPIKRALEKLMSWILYGGEISYVSVIGRLADSLSTTLDRETLCHLLVSELATVLRLAQVGLYLRDDDNMLAFVDAIGFEPIRRAHQIASDSKLTVYLQAAGTPISDAQMRRGLAGTALSAEEQALLSTAGFAYWVPLISADTLQGLVLIGPKVDDDPFTAENVQILATLARQAGIAAHNVKLMEQVRAGRQELSHAHRELLAAHERERKQLAHELHDDSVQQLLGISYQVLEQESVAGKGLRPDAVPSSEMRVQELETIRCGIVGVVTQLRGLISDLRPAGLEDVGLGAALEEYVSRLDREGGVTVPDIELDIDVGKVELPEQVSLCLFRAAQEALRNALKHAEAKHICLSLYAHDGFVELIAQDDGRGFRVPSRLSELASRNHFGLIGIAERVAWAGGQFEIASRPGEGVRVCVRVPLQQTESKNGQNYSSVAGG